MRKIWLLAALAPVFAACASTPAYRYYTLDMSPHANLAAPVAIANVRLRVNEALSRPEILVRTSPTQVEYYALDRWASGLDEQLAEKLKTEFAAQTEPKYHASISGTLMSFEQIDTPAGPEVRVKLDVYVDIQPSGDGYSALYQHAQPAASSSPVAVVEALSRSVEAIAQQIAADIERAVPAAESGQ